MSNFLEKQNLNEKQLEAVKTTEGPMLILAAPGAGKTRVLTTKIAYLISEKKINPENILALTFTNKAAKEMKNRITSMLSNIDLSRSLIGTFHSCFVKILRANTNVLGLGQNFTIYDSSDSRDILSSIVSNMKLKSDIYQSGLLLERISVAKNKLISPVEYGKNDIFLEEDSKLKIPKFYKVYEEYEKYLKEVNVMDFDDILVNTYKLFTEHKDITARYQDFFKYIFVDEFQDTNFVQAKILKILSEKNKNICVVGDDSQSIYGFRGATIKNIVEFKKDYDGCKVIKLEQNYRSVKNIVGLANSLIKNNKERLDKKIWTDNEEGEKCKIIQCSNGIEEARMISMLIKNKIKEEKYNEEDIAILYRTNSQSKILETEFRAQGINYRICGGMSFYQYEEVKDFIAFLRVIVNCNDVEAIKRTLNKPRRGIGNTTIDKVFEKLEEEKKIDNKITLWDILVQSRSKFGLRIAELLQKYVDIVEPFMNQINTRNAYDIAYDLYEKVGFKEYYESLDTEESEKQNKNLEDLLNSIKMFVDDPLNIDKGLVNYLQNLPLEADKIDEEKEMREFEENDEIKKKVSLMTVHASKGLEYKCVYIIGFEEGIFPSYKSTKVSDIEEERRLFYVAITRAKEYLGISYSLTRYINGKVKECKPSRFLDELDTNFIDEDTITMDVIKNINRSEKKDHANYSMFKYSIVSRKISESSRVVLGNIKSGAPIYHSIYGNGKVIEINPSNDNIIRVKFAKYGEKELVKDFSKILVFDKEK